MLMPVGQICYYCAGAEHLMWSIATQSSAPAIQYSEREASCELGWVGWLTSKHSHLPRFASASPGSVTAQCCPLPAQNLCPIKNNSSAQKNIKYTHIHDFVSQWIWKWWAACMYHVSSSHVSLYLCVTRTPGTLSPCLCLRDHSLYCLITPSHWVTEAV